MSLLPLLLLGGAGMVAWTYRSKKRANYRKYEKAHSWSLKQMERQTSAKTKKKVK